MKTFSMRRDGGSVADTIWMNGDILTGVGLEAAALGSGRAERVRAMAAADGVILATGSDAEMLERFRGAGTEMVDLRGAFAMPGFNDAHVHLGMGGRILLSVNLLGTKSLEEMQARVRAAAEIAQAGEWLTGGGWDETLWAERRLPTRADLDAVTLGHPAIFQRVDVHAAVANSAALAAAGLMGAGPERATCDPEGGAIGRDASGEPTGILRETAMGLVQAPLPTAEQRRRGLELAVADAIRHGVTSVQDFSDWEDVLVLEEMEREGRLPVRVAEWLPFTDSVEALERKRARREANDRMLRTTMVKGFLDGSLGSRTAAMKAPYSDDVGNAGLPRFAQDELNGMAVERARAGFQLGFHAIGDCAVEMALNAIAAAGETARPRIEHSQVVSAGDFARYRELGAIASVQPNHMLTDMAWASERLGQERAARAYAWRSFAEAGVTLAFGTDYPVEPVTPFRGIYAAVTRRNEAGTASFCPEQALTMEQAMWAYTQGAAYAEFAETWKGKLAAGHVADFVALDRDLTAVKAEDVLKTQVMRTVVGGRTVWERG